MRKLRSSYLMTGYCIGILINSTWAQAEDVGKSTDKILNDPRCELHIWPTEAHHAFFGFQFNGLVGAIVDSVGSPSHLYSNDEIEKLTESWLDTPSQLALIETVGLSKLLKLEDYKIVVEQPMPGNLVSIRAMDEQLHSNIPNVPCRAEFRIVRITYEKDGWNRSLIS
ncbi:hypothetical protein [Novosphingobium sp.]|uniref:hypothetical protein n=1 Tax=Novosphingobium sp. TaxID=1874826 RepID=UPI003342DCE0